MGYDPYYSILIDISLVGTTTLSPLTTFDRIIYLEGNNNMIEPTLQPLLSLGTNTITQSIKNINDRNN